MIRKAVIVVLTLGAVGTAVLCAESYRKLRGHNFVYLGLDYEGGYTWHWTLENGQLQVQYGYRVPRDSVETPSWSSFSLFGLRFAYQIQLRDYGDWFEGGGRPLPASRRCGTRHVHVEVPLWHPLVVFAAYPILAFIRGPARRYRRRKRGLCIKCGYNLTGNVSGVCSECGTMVSDRPDAMMRREE